MRCMMEVFSYKAINNEAPQHPTKISFIVALSVVMTVQKQVGDQPQRWMAWHGIRPSSIPLDASNSLVRSPLSTLCQRSAKLPLCVVPVLLHSTGCYAVKGGVDCAELFHRSAGCQNCRKIKECILVTNSCIPDTR